jgi:uncharacterized RDD family membrane protein YckC
MDNVIDDLFQLCMERLKKNEYRELDPLVEYIGKRVWPYIVFASLMFLLILLILVVLFVVILNHHKLTKPLLCDGS